MISVSQWSVFLKDGAILALAGAEKGKKEACLELLNLIETVRLNFTFLNDF